MALGCVPWRLAPLADILLAGDCVTNDNAERRARYNCDDGSMLTVIFAGDNARLLNDGGPAIVLARRPVASGFCCEAGTRSIRGKGRSLTCVVGRRAPIPCRQVGSGG